MPTLPSKYGMRKKSSAAVSVLEEHEKNLLAIANSVATSVITDGLDEEETGKLTQKVVGKFLAIPGAVDSVLVSTHLTFEDEDIKNRMLVTNPFLKDPTVDQFKRYTAALVLETELEDVLKHVLKERNTICKWKIHLINEKRYLTFDEADPDCDESLDGQEATYNDGLTAYRQREVYVSTMNAFNLYPKVNVVGFNIQGEVISVD